MEKETLTLSVRVLLNVNETKIYSKQKSDNNKIVSKKRNREKEIEDTERQDHVAFYFFGFLAYHAVFQIVSV